ncbi:MFS transporter [Streptosporangium subroseum]|nr:MFS transporter [Streptosporangium subroseum]
MTAVAAARPTRTGWTLVLASIGTFITALDVVVVSTALPTLRAHLGASLSDLEWTINAYNLAFACLMLTGAALGDRFGRRRMYVLGLGLFTLASAACALSTSVDALIVARIVQGVGAAVVLPLTLTLISDAFPVEKRGAAIGIWGGVTGLGVAAGPIVGGAIIQGISWQWIFWINVPIGVVSLVLSAFLLRESRGPRPQLDLVGLVLAALALLALTWAPVRAPSVGWGSGEVIGALVAGVVLMAGFLVWERRTPYPMLPLAYFKRRAFSTANAVVFFQQISLIGSLFMITQLFQTGLGYDPLGAGLRILVWTAMPMLVAPIAGALSDRIGNKPFMLAGLLLQGGGLAWLAAATEPGVGYGSLVVPLIVAGIGIAMCFPTVANAVVAAVPIEDSGVAAGTNNALREIGGVFGVAILAAVFIANGDYSSPARFVDGFKAAEMVAAAVALVGVIAAILAPSKKAVAASGDSVTPLPEKALAGS